MKKLVKKIKIKGVLSDSFKDKLNEGDIELILKVFYQYEKINIDEIERLKRDRQFDVKKVNGALKQTINAHGPITKELIGSASKRIMGMVMLPTKKTLLEKIKLFLWK